MINFTEKSKLHFRCGILNSVCATYTCSGVTTSCTTSTSTTAATTTAACAAGKEMSYSMLLDMIV